MTKLYELKNGQKFKLRDEEFILHHMDGSWGHCARKEGDDPNQIVIRGYEEVNSFN